MFVQCKLCASHSHAYCVQERGKNVANRDLDVVSDVRLRDVLRWYERASSARPVDSESARQHAVFLDRLAGPDAAARAEELFLKSLEAEPNNLAALQEYSSFLAERRGAMRDADLVMNRYEEARKELAVDI